MKTYVDVIKETIKYYSDDPENKRSLKINSGMSSCLYNGPDGKQCAFSRCAKSIPDHYDKLGKFASEVLKKEGINILKEEYRHLNNFGFWNELQHLHDDCNNWIDNGLSEVGKSHANSLIEKYK